MRLAGILLIIGIFFIVSIPGVLSNFYTPLNELSCIDDPFLSQCISSQTISCSQISVISGDPCNPGSGGGGGSSPFHQNGEFLYINTSQYVGATSISLNGTGTINATWVNGTTGRFVFLNGSATADSIISSFRGVVPISSGTGQAFNFYMNLINTRYSFLDLNAKIAHIFNNTGSMANNTILTTNVTIPFLAACTKLALDADRRLFCNDTYPTPPVSISNSWILGHNSSQIIPNSTNYAKIVNATSGLIVDKNGANIKGITVVENISVNLNIWNWTLDNVGSCFMGKNASGVLVMGCN